ncbi:MAG: hypothetical protein IPJ08_21740 [Burkholderiales bacterium]|nr:hypothetical protein [Burkholderiales bacterium]
MARIVVTRAKCHVMRTSSVVMPAKAGIQPSADRVDARLRGHDGVGRGPGGLCAGGLT